MRVTSGCLIGLAALASVACSRPAAVPGQAAATASTTARIEAPKVDKPAPAWIRDHYRSLADCAADWGHAGKCVPADATAAAGATFSGPYYARNYREETQFAARKEAFENGYLTELREQPSDVSIGRSTAQGA